MLLSQITSEGRKIDVSLLSSIHLKVKLCWNALKNLLFLNVVIFDFMLQLNKANIFQIFLFFLFCFFFLSFYSNNLLFIDVFEKH